MVNSRGNSFISYILLVVVVLHTSVSAAERPVRIAFSRETDFIDRLHTDSMESAALSLAVYDTLLYRDSDSGRIEGLLADSWIWNAARNVIEFTLRSGVRFHNGEYLDADDVVFTIGLLTDSANDVHFRQREFSFGFIEYAEKLSQYRVRIHLKQPNPLAEHVLSTRLIIWPQIYTQDNGGHLIHRTAPIGTGPYRAVTVEPGKKTVLAANNDYFKGPKSAAAVSRLIIRTIPDLQTQIAELLKGSLDFIWGLPADHVRFLKEYSQLAVAYADSARITFLSLNAGGRHGSDLLVNSLVRQAITHAIDRESITESFMAGNAEALYYHCHPAQQNCLSIPQNDYLYFDPAKAKSLLKEAGYEDTINLEIMLGSDELRKVGEVLQWQLQQVGIDLSLRTFTLPAWRKKFMAGESVISLVSYGGDLFDVAATLPTFFSFGPADYARDPALTRLVRRAIAETDTAQRRDLFEDVLHYISDRAYTVPLYTNPISFVFHNDLIYESGGLPFPDVTRLSLRNTQED